MSQKNKKSGLLTFPSNELTLNEYQQWAGVTAKYPGRGKIQGLLYCIIGAAGEAGEIANLGKKILRDHNSKLTKEFAKKLFDENSDLLWYCSQIAFELKKTFGELGIHNINKLADRQKRGVIKGHGDKR